MRITTRRDATAQDIARLHRSLAEARLALLTAVKPAELTRRLPLTAASQDSIVRQADRLLVEIFRLESAFMRTTGDRSAPFANPSRPTEWLDWLDQRGRP